MNILFLRNLFIFIFFILCNTSFAQSIKDSDLQKLLIENPLVVNNIPLQDKSIYDQKLISKNQNVANLKTNIYNKKINQSVIGNTNSVYINPLNSLRFVLNKLQKDKIKINKNFYVFTGSSVGVVPILGKGVYKGVISKIGSVSAKIS